MSDAPRTTASGAGPRDDEPPEPIAVGAAAVHIELPEFEGPLDLLLHLIKKEELEIVNIPISLITERYLHYIGLMQTLNLDIAGEYLLMAATLAYLKSRELVPQAPEDVEADKQDDEDELGDPRQALIRRLLEYQKYKEAAAYLGDRPVMGRNVWGRGAPADIVAGSPPQLGETLEEVPVFRLIESLEKVLARARITLTHDVVVERISITDKINELVDKLDKERAFTFAACFAFLESGGVSLAELRHQVVVTFMALLEMTRLRMIRLYQAADRGDIYIARIDVAASEIVTRATEAGAAVATEAAAPATEVAAAVATEAAAPAMEVAAAVATEAAAPAMETVPEEAPAAAAETEAAAAERMTEEAPAETETTAATETGTTTSEDPSDG